jgi:hypothetical protein
MLEEISFEFNIIELVFGKLSKNKTHPSPVWKIKIGLQWSHLLSFQNVYVPEEVWYGRPGIMVWDLSISIPLCHPWCDLITSLSITQMFIHAHEHFSCDTALYLVSNIEHMIYSKAEGKTLLNLLRTGVLLYIMLSPYGIFKVNLCVCGFCLISWLQSIDFREDVILFSVLLPGWFS